MENVTLSDIAAAVQAGGVGVSAAGDPRAVVVTGTSCDSRTTRAGDLFVCKGAAFRPAFLTGALERGAVAYLCDEAHAAELAAVAPGTPALVVDNLRRAMALASAEAFGHPDRDLPVIGITGTKGKTTAAYMLRSIVEAAHGEGSCGIIGTVESYDGAGRAASNNTTPEPPDLWRHLANARNAGLAALVMEVSSQALKYDRTLGVGLAAGCFLNIGLDHISPVEHADFEDYFSSKLRIFSQANVAVVNLDSDHADRVLAAAGAAPRTLTFGVNRADADVFADELAPSEDGIAFTLHLHGQTRRVRLPFPGEFSVSDALCAAACADLLGIDAEKIAAGLAATHVPGRMEFHRSADRRLTVVVDYAHNGFAFESLLSTVAGTFAGARTIAVFGAVGGKARERRYELPEVAARYVDYVILTADDPWTEDPADICREMERALPDGFPHEVVLDREAAAERAFELAEESGGRAVVLLLAKGHEAYQLTREGFVPCVSDRELARRGIAAHDREHPADGAR
ncbi:UDP-N-acetylmuramoyl-L-alanyl-D-glutamate--2,6-diaminopimelate ligase [Olsenella uli]|uniref:Mur ligase family protein n=1 Tax=Olsenella uli TaxID=133926 RepID=UPI0019579342|nr:UDP-N-acetylmuramoyl-L-alanyl-D-glutamate--2,6-diaminopimelate ligase [Olsenella uli]MBM6676981.1 UDP-N-acetylmuramoyl-L-alanyl-D-glutamate--2,6-diaminopimelate ligase [Olsenella uli]